MIPTILMYSKALMLLYVSISLSPYIGMRLQNGKLYGRGATDDKGPIMAWLNAIEMFHSTKVDIPVNIKV